MSSGPASAPSLVLGTAGHIDHGKTALVRALTGVDTDRLPEEKARGITLVLGFAPLDLADSDGALRLSVVDVPGHEGLVRTMVSGATGIDLVLLVVAADEGVMPQTREHAAICELLGLSRGVVALTKRDLVGEEALALAEQEVRSLLAAGPLAALPVLAVSSTTGAGLPALRAALLAAARGAAPRTPRTGPPRLAVDRVFTRPGFGTVVTGTLVGAPLAVGEMVEILPGAERVKIRGLQSHGAPTLRAEPGIRCAVNLQGAIPAELARGSVLSRPGALGAATALDVSLRWLPGAPPLREEASAELLAGTLERRIRVLPIGPRHLRPGDQGFARLQIEGEPVFLLPGDRFVLRGFARSGAAGATLGGGVVLDAAPQRRRRSDPALVEALALLAQHEPGPEILHRIERRGLEGVTRPVLSRESGLDDAVLGETLADLARRGLAFEADPRWLSAAAVADLEARTRAALDAEHAARPLLPGMPRGALRGRLPSNVDPAAFEFVLARLVAAHDVACEGDLVRRAGHRPRETTAESKAAEALRTVLREAGLEPPSLRDLATRLGLEAPRLRQLLAHLERERAIVRAPGDLFFDRAAVDALRQRLVAHLTAHGAIDTPAYKALIGTTRRTAVPLMELFDAERVTLRTGERRVLRRKG